MDEKRLARLPKWAQDEITTLRRKVDGLARELKVQQCDAPSRIQWGHAWGAASAKGYLQNDEYIAFTPKADGHERPIRVHFNLDHTHLEIHCDGAIVVKPTSRNWVQISVEP